MAESYNLENLNEFVTLDVDFDGTNSEVEDHHIAPLCSLSAWALRQYVRVGVQGSHRRVIELQV